MKLLSVFLFAACLATHARSTAQTVTFSGKDVPLTRLFSVIKDQTGYVFFYDQALLKDARPVTLDVKDAPLEKVLQQSFKDQPFGWTIVNKTITIIEKEVTTPKVEEVAPLPAGIDVSGKVTDAEGNPLVGASVTVKGKKLGTTTDISGVFILKGLDENDELVITYSGYIKQSFKVGAKTSFMVKMEVEEKAMDEVIINKGYYTEKQRVSVGNAQTITAKDIQKHPVTNVLQAIQGYIPGIEITQTSGIPGSAFKTRIQGINSIGSIRTDNTKTGTDPLIIIDGVIYPSNLFSSRLEDITQGGSSLAYINPQDIESVTVLKDADATSIYGSRAANGAIVITTKRGKPGKARLNVNLQQGWGKVTRFADMMNTRQYLDMRYEAFRNNNILLSTQTPNSSNYDLTFWDTTRYTNWQKELIGGTAQYTNANVSISGGTVNLSYLIGGNFNRQTTVFPGNFDNKDAGLHFNINTSSNDQRLRLQLTGSYSYNKNFLPNLDLTNTAIKMEPDAPALYKPDGALNWAQNATGNSTWINPLAYTLSSDFCNNTKNLVSNAVISYRILPGLDIRSSFGYTDLQSDIYQPKRLELERPERRTNTTRRAFFGKRGMSSWIIEPQLQYAGNIWKGKIDGLLGTTIQKSNSNNLAIQGTGFSSDLLMKTLKAATTVSIYGSASEENRFNALFGRLNYNLADKYMLNLTARRDGSNKFGDANKFHNFWSVGTGWIFSEENFLHKYLSFISFGKLRVSYGTTGNDQIPSFSYLSIYDINRPDILYQGNFGLNPRGVPNPHLQWEETRKCQSGVDLGIFNNRINISVTYAFNRSSNQLIGYILPNLTGFATITKNLPATVQNTSWELLANLVIVKGKDFSWSSSANLTIPRNKVLSFPGIENTSYASGNDGIIVGQPIGATKTYRYGGIDPTTGKYVGVDKNGNFTFSPNGLEDATVLLSTMTKWYGGWVHNFSYKGFQLDILFQFVRKLGPRELFYYNGANYPGQFSWGNSNQPVSVINHWQKAGDIATIARYSLDDLAIGNIIGSNNLYSYDASYIRLKNVSLSWQLPLGWIQKAHVNSANLYFRAENLATITNYTGLDPETMGTSLPPLQMWTIGAQIGL